MSDNAISSGILQTSSLIITVIVVAASFSVAYGISAGISTSGENLSRQMNMDFDIIGVGNVGPTNISFAVYVKNTGAESISAYVIIDVFLNGLFYEYNSSDSSVKRWTVTLLSDHNSDGNWGMYETIGMNLTMDSGNQLGAGNHEIRISIYGNVESYSFSV